MESCRYKEQYIVGFYGSGEDFRENLILGALATVFQAEVLVIKHCTEFVATKTSSPTFHGS